MPAGIALVPRSAAGRRLAKIRAFFRGARLDAALAGGADPWSDGDLMARAGRLSSLSQRRHVAAGLVALVALADQQRSGSPFLAVRHRVVHEQRESLLALAERLGEPAPVEVAVVAQLALLLSDSSSPVYAGGEDPHGLAEATSRCLQSLSDDLTPD
jgi:hypothetical protein